MKNRYLLVEDIELFPGESEDKLGEKVMKKYGISPLSVKISKKSLDARKKSRIVYKYRLIIECAEGNFKSDKKISEYKEPEEIVLDRKTLAGKHVLVVGSGPAGLFSALRLIEWGAKVTILERGRSVDHRLSDISLLEKSGELNLESNVLFGEGGAGTYSDGKLTTRINKPGIDWFYSRLVKNGGNPSLLYDSKPHVGTDKLVTILINIRKFITDSGSEILFNERVNHIIEKNGKIIGVRTSSDKEFTGDALIWATGHSARDSYELLHRSGIAVEKKGFAVGARIEHPAEFINKNQYGKYADRLPAADYRLTHTDKKINRGVYSFCMCPGGVVVNSSSERGMLCVNGMSYADRGLAHSNSAMVVSVHPEDFPGGPLSGIDFQREIERKAYEAGGCDFIAPAQRVKSFMGARVDTSLPEISYKRGGNPADLRTYLPGFVVNLLVEGLKKFNHRIPGFIEEGVFIGAETRTSSPVRIVRGKNRESLSLENFYPIGEGAGYAGGIVSSAVDGIRSVDMLVEKLSTI